MVIGLDASRANIAERTGTEKYAREVIQRMLPLLRQHHVRLYVREPLLPDWPELESHVEVRVLNWAPGLLWSHLRLSWELLWHRPDVLFVPADTVPIVHPRQTVTTIHDIAFERFPELYRKKTVQRRLGWLRPFINAAVRLFTLGRYSASERDYHRWSVRQAIRASTAILTVSDFSKQEIVDVLRVSPSRIVVTHLGVLQPEHFAAITTQHRKEVLRRLRLDRPFILYLSRLESKKNIGQVIQSYHRYRQQVPSPLDLVLVGNPGYGWEDANTFLAQQEYRSCVHTLGWQPDSIVDVLHVAAQALICISQYEGFGLPTIESFSAGVPVISSRHGSLPEVLGPIAYYVDDQSIDSVVQGMIESTTPNVLRTSRIQQGLQHVRQFTWETTAKKTAEQLEAACLRV